MGTVSLRTADNPDKLNIVDSTHNIMESEAFEKLGIEHVPGTEVMKDVGDVHFAHGNKNCQVLIPHPSSALDDPLNWKMKWKLLAISVQIAYCWVTVASALSVSPMNPLLAAEFDLSQTQLNLITGSCVLALGYANFIIVPMSNIFGRRPTSIALAAFAAGSCIWEARAQSYGSLIGARVVNGFATATSESMAVQVICDLFFLHERGFWMGVYFVTYFLGLFVGPIISGAIASRHGWRSFFWLSLGLATLNLVSLILLFPETKYQRDEHDALFQAHAQSPVPPPASTASRKGAVTLAGDSEHVDAITSGGQAIEKSSDPESALPAASSSPVGNGRPSKAQWKLFRRPDTKWKSMILKDIISAASIFFFPIIFWAGITVAGFANLLLLWNITQSEILAAPPYNFSVSAVGYTNFAFVVGGLIGLGTGGKFSDWLAKRSTKAANGIRQPEMRLPALLPYLVLSIVAAVVGGMAEENHWAWPILVVVGYGVSGLCITAAPAIAIAYAIDSYKLVAGEIMVVATVLKNTCGFSMSYWVPQLTQSSGALTPPMVQLALTAGPVLLALPLWVWGHKLRRWTRNSRVHAMEG